MALLKSTFIKIFLLTILLNFTSCKAYGPIMSIFLPLHYFYLHLFELFLFDEVKLTKYQKKGLISCL